MVNFSCELGNRSALEGFPPSLRFLLVFSEGTSRGQSDLPRVNVTLSTNYSPQ